MNRNCLSSNPLSSSSNRTFGITATGDMFNLYVLLEIASFSAYAIIAMGERGADFAAFAM
ncbi:MAG: hypothetical protein KIIPBIDF_02122 [Candidatus Methanoperedenaceae archaeon GB50]|nr:MAG: hypothetical protein KIIPBIDF_02122 [Candidatus Methanoperedenaceae archaeon GB50]